MATSGDLAEKAEEEKAFLCADTQLWPVVASVKVALASFAVTASLA